MLLYVNSELTKYMPITIIETFVKYVYISNFICEHIVNKYLYINGKLNCIYILNNYIIFCILKHV